MKEVPTGIPSFEQPVVFPKDCPLRIGVIGAGGVANGAHLPQYRKMGYQVVGCADIKAENAEATRERWNLSFAYTEYRQLLERKDVDVVLVTVHPESRAQVVRDAVSAGKHILVEKPFAHSYADAVTMVQAAAKAGVKLAVNQNRRWLLVHRATRLLLDSAAIGAPYFTVYTGRSNQEYLVGSWYERYRHFLLIEFCVHHLDLLVYWLGEPTSLYATTGHSPSQRFAHDMVTMVTLNYPSGARAQLSINDVALDPGRGSYWDHDDYVIDGDQGLIRKVDDQRISITSVQTGGATVQKALAPIDSFAASMGDLLDAIQNDREPSCSGQRNLATLRIVFAACRSADEQRVVTTEEIAREVGP